MKLIFKTKYKKTILIIFSIALVTIIAIIKYRSGEINYLNADATWHTLLTIKAYNETPMNVHHFIPIVSIGDDKGIPWGATIPDNYGNYYYTSFSPAGYIFPWIFIKIFNLPIAEGSIYLFNSILFLLSSVLWGNLIYHIYRKSKYALLIGIIGVLTYAVSPELLHGMGISYWHQSIMQVTLLIQIIAWIYMHEKKSVPFAILFVSMCILNPYIEWTGYVANLGFAFTELILWRKKKQKERVQIIFTIVVLTIISFILFCVHFLSVVNLKDFLTALSTRFLVRTVGLEADYSEVAGGYIKSFLYLWILLISLMVLDLVKTQRIVIRKGYLFLILCIPIIENVIMKQHAMVYLYDQMKVGFCLSFLLCEIAYDLSENTNGFKSILVLTVVCSFLNLNSYIKNEEYIWKADYRKNNAVLAEYINQKFGQSSILAMDEYPVRGYINLLFNRGIYENKDIDELFDIAKKRKKQYAIMINAKEYEERQVYELSGAIIYDVKSNNRIDLLLKDDKISIKVSNDEKAYSLADYTDQNWTNGYSNFDNTVLSKNTNQLLEDILMSKIVKCDNEQFDIIKVQYDKQWIRVTLDREAKNCMYPAKIVFE